MNALKQQTKLLLPVSILIVLFLMLTTSLLTQQYTKIHTTQNLQSAITLSIKISNLIHETQKERGYSSGFVTQGKVVFQTDLKKQRHRTDKKIEELQKYSQQFQNKILRRKLHDALHSLKKIKDIRKQIDDLSLNNMDVIGYYSSMNNQFLDVIVTISKMSENKKIMQYLIAYSNFLYAKENAGIERAVGIAILSQNHFIENQRRYFTNLVEAQKLYFKAFEQYSCKDVKTYYTHILHVKAVDEVTRIRNVILSKNQNFHVKPQYWFAQITQKIDRLKIINDYMEKGINQSITMNLHQNYALFVLYTLLNLIVFSIFVILVVFLTKLIKSEKRFRDITDKHIISSITDTKGKILDASDAFCKISQYSKEELIGKSHNIVRHPDMPQSVFKDLWSTIKTGKSWSGKVKNRTKNGDYYWVYANIEPLFDKKGTIEAYAAIRIDITDKVRLKEELEEKRQKDQLMLKQSKLAQMGELLSMIAHQWRQPLNATNAIVGDLLLKIEMQSYTESYFIQKLEKILELSGHLSNTIYDFRNFYKEDKRKEQTVFQEIVENSLAIIQDSLDAKGIRVQTVYKSQAQLFVYKNELTQVVLNLLKNAEDALVEVGVATPTIVISSYDTHEDIVLEISDNAGGIPSDILDKLFDPYFSTKEKKDGTGLGLYMSKIIIEEHFKGLLEATNTKEGACFRIKFNKESV